MDTEDIKDIRDFIQEKVVEAYHESLEELVGFNVAPNLKTIYEILTINIVDDIYDVYEFIFGEGTQLRADWLEDIGVDPQGLPHILTVCEILNAFKLGYEYGGITYNFFPQSILFDIPVE